jgi:putative peptide-modifying radical SAM enzyme
MALTSRCNLKCKYCYGKCTEDFLTQEELKKYDFNIPQDTTVSIKQLQDLAKKDPELIITFYGGEPLLKIDYIKEIINKVPAKEFMIQTNALNIDKLPKKYLNKISTILASIDGTKEHTDERRGKGVYDKVISNIKKLRKGGYNGHIIARMTVDETCDIYENVTHLSQIKEFDGIHWQIDAQFFKSDFKERNFKEWVDESYNPQITKLIDWWIKEYKKLPVIYPFTAIMYSLLTNEKVPMRCGAGHSVLGLQTNGIIAGCPITAGFKPLYMGDVKTATPKTLKQKKIQPDKQCLDCEIKYICGGRCLYANKSQLWGKKGYKQVCDTIFYLINELKRVKSENKLDSKDFEYRKYNGVEVIP